VLDTSFWTVGFKVGLVGYVLQLFEIVVPRAVEREIMYADRQYPARDYPNTALFREVRELMAEPAEEPPPLRVFGGGEAAAIPLARQLNATLLVNDRRPVTFARNLGIRVTTVPDMIVFLRSREFIPEHMARAMLTTSQRHGTSPVLVEAAEQLLSALSSSH
jgi:predicted nucleic acid-binding protein